MKKRINRLFLRLLISMAILAIFPACCRATALGDDVQIDRAASREGRIWYLKKDKRNEMAGIYSVAPGEGGKPRLEGKVDVKISKARLLADDDRLWIITNNAISFYRGGEVAGIKKTNKLGDFSRPFIYKGKPALTEQRGDMLFLDVFDGVEWRKEAELELMEGVTECPEDGCYLEVVADGAGELYFFAWDGKDVYWRKGIPYLKEEKARKVTGKEIEGGAGADLEETGEANEKSGWELIGKAAESFSSGLIGGRPAVFMSRGSGISWGITGYRLDDGKWAEIYKRNNALFFPRGFGVYPADGAPDEFVIIRQSIAIFGPVYAYAYKGNEIKSAVKIGGFPKFGGMLLVEILILIGLVFELVFTSLGPFWWFKAGITVFKESRKFQTGQIDYDKIMAMDFSKTKAYIVKKWPERRALTFRAKRNMTNSTGRRGNPSVLYFIQVPGGIELKIKSKLPVISSVCILFMMGFIVFLIADVFGMMKSGSVAIAVAGMTLFFVFSMVYAMYLTVKYARKGGKELFDLALTVFGVESLPEARPTL